MQEDNSPFYKVKIVGKKDTENKLFDIAMGAYDGLSWWN